MIIALLLWLGSKLPVAADTDQAATYHKLIALGKTAQLSDAPDLATGAFVKATRIAPENPQAHLLLAERFLKSGQSNRAEAYLRTLIKRPDQRRSVALYLQALDHIARQRPILVSGSFVLKPTSNVNNVSSERHFDTLLGRFNINDGGAEQFGIGAELGGNLIYRLPLGTGRHLAFSGGLDRGIYQQDKLRFWRMRLAADLKQISPTQDWRLGLFTHRKRYNDTIDNSGELLSYGLRANVGLDLPSRRRVRFGTTVEQREYLNSPTLSGPFLSLSTTLRTPYANGHLSTLTLRIERRKTDLDYHRYWGAGLHAGGETNITGNLRMGLNAGFTFRTYDARFAALDYSRRDKIWTVGVSATHRQISVFGATPKISCSHERQQSNVALYSRATTACDVGWFYQF